MPRPDNTSDMRRHFETSGALRAFGLENVTKAFGPVVANDDITLDIPPGETLALLGENGAGKSTLMSILAGALIPDSGRVLVNGLPVLFRSPRDAIKAGVGMVYQHFMLVDSMTVAQNVFLGQTGAGLSRPRLMEELTRELAARYGLEAPADAMVGDLSMGEKQRVEILKLLLRESRILIFDEPTTVLTSGETEQLFHAFSRMTAMGKSVVFISHKMPEVLRAADSIAILRKGRVVDRFRRDEAPSESELAARMVGREVLDAALLSSPAELLKEGAMASDDAAQGPITKPATEISANNHGSAMPSVMEGSGATHDDDGGDVASASQARGRAAMNTARESEEPALELKNLSGPGLVGINLRVRRGEIVAVAGVAGNGQKALVETICGLAAPERGHVRILGQSWSDFYTANVTGKGLAYIPEDRRGLAVCPELSLVDNVLLTARRMFTRRGFIERDKAWRATAELIRRFDVDAPSPDALARRLSGGNLQKLVLAREFFREPRIIVAEQPTQGLDVAAAAEVWRRLSQARERAGVLLITGDVSEALRLADRVAVMYRGRFMAVFPRSDTAMVAAMGELMAGVSFDKARE